jgi:hypothetical protein
MNRGSLAKSVYNWKINHPGVLRTSGASCVRQWCTLTARYRSLPDFLIIGAPKCGTTSLYNLLARHPQVLASHEKETRYLNHGNKPTVQKYKQFFPLKFFLSNKTQTFEATTTYFSNSLVAEFLTNHLPDTKLILMVRDPVQRAVSQFNHFIQRGRESASIEDAFHILLDAYEGSKSPAKTKCPNCLASDYFRYGFYSEFLPYWEKWLEKGDFLLVVSETFYGDPDHELKRVCNFLNLAGPLPLTNAIYNQGKSRVELPHNLQKRLRNLYEPYNLKLSERFGLELTW